MTLSSIAFYSGLHSPAGAVAGLNNKPRFLCRHEAAGENLGRTSHETGYLAAFFKAMASFRASATPFSVASCRTRERPGSTRP